MLTYHLKIIPEDECKNRGIYVMDPLGKFSSCIGVYNKESRSFLGLSSLDMIIQSCHVDTESGFARPVVQLPGTCTVPSLEPYTVYNDNLEISDKLNSGKVSIANWDLYVFLDEYENAYASGAFE